jgi:hypothetical protein
VLRAQSGTLRLEGTVSLSEASVLEIVIQGPGSLDAFKATALWWQMALLKSALA